jgi:hypothetical protein
MIEPVSVIDLLKSFKYLCWLFIPILCWSRRKVRIPERVAKKAQEIHGKAGFRVNNGRGILVRRKDSSEIRSEKGTSLFFSSDSDDWTIGLYLRCFDGAIVFV